MLVLDENISVLEREKLRAMRLRARAIGETLAAFGTDDADLIPVLHRLPSPTFFTHDSDFLRRDWWHAGYALVWLDLPDDEAASYIRRFLRHPAFKTAAQRMGCVARVHPGGVDVWRSRHGETEHVTWLRSA